MQTLPLKSIKNILRGYYEGEISIETAILLRNVLQEIADYLAAETVREFHNQNHIREIQGLSPLKRLDKTSLKTVWESILNQITNKNTNGEVGKHNRTLLCQDGVRNETKT